VGGSRREPLRRAPVDLRVKEFKRELPGGNPYANQATRNVVRLADVITDAVNARLREHDLHLAAAQALAVLEGAREPLTPNEINAHLHLTSGSVTSLLDRLEKRALVARHPHPTDRRKVLVSITEAGRALVDTHLPETVAIQTALFRVLTAEQLTELNHLIETVLLAANDLDPHAVADAAPPRGPH
jgi:DNA-binding MarR family transcriptional regulator